MESRVCETAQWKHGGKPLTFPRTGEGVGGFDLGQPHYYRVQGGHFVLEYDNTQNDANHVHSVWRDFDHDFDMDLLKAHLDATHAK